MAKFQKISEETKQAVYRKSAAALPNNPTSSGWKAEDIRRALYTPIIDAANSAFTEIDRIVNAMNAVFGLSSANVDIIESVAGLYYHGSNGLIYTRSAEGFSVYGYEGDGFTVVIPATVNYQGEYISVDGIEDNAFKGKEIVSVEIPATIKTIGENAFASCVDLTEVKLLGLAEVASNAFIPGNIDFSVPKEYLTEYGESLGSVKHSLTGVDTVANNALEIGNLYSSKLSKITGTNDFQRVYTVTKLGGQVTRNLVETPYAGEVPLYNTDGRLKGNAPTEGNDLTNKTYVENRLEAMGAKVSFTINPTTYVMTLQLKNERGTVLSTGTVDLPLESMILGATYADGVLTLNIKTPDGSLEGNKIQVNISDLISGLVNDETFNTQVGRLDRRIDTNATELTMLKNEVGQKEIFGSYAYHAEEAETARKYSKGGKIDKKFRDLEKEEGTSLSLSMDDEYRLTVKLLNKKGEVLSSGTVDLPIESLITKAEYKNGTLTLTFQSGDKTNIDISSIVNGLVPETRKVNGKSLNADITLTAGDVGAYGKTETYTKTEVSNLLASAKQELQVAIDEKEVVGFAYSSTESEKARGFIKGGGIDKRFLELEKRIKALE